MAEQHTRQVSSSSVEGMVHLMRSVLLQLSGLAGILSFLSQMWSHASLEQSLLTGAVIGGGVYMILLLVDISLERIVVAQMQTAREQARARAQAERESAAEAENDEQDRETSDTPEDSEDSDSSASRASEEGEPSVDTEMVTA